MDGGCPPPTYQLGQEIILVLSRKIICCAGATTQAFAILQLLNITQTSCDAAVTIGVVAIEGNADLAVTAGINLTLVQNGLDICVHNLGCLAAVGVEEVTASVCFIVGTVDIAITQRSLQIGRDLAAPMY